MMNDFAAYEKPQATITEEPEDNNNTSNKRAQEGVELPRIGDYLWWHVLFSVICDSVQPQMLNKFF